MSIHYYQYDLPDGLDLGKEVAIDTEAMGLNNHRDRLCVVQLSAGDKEAHLVHFPKPKFDQSPNLLRLLTDNTIKKLFHFARFDVAIIMHYFGIELSNVYCTKIASRLARTYTDQHSLRELCSEILRVRISKQQQTSDWGAGNLTIEQREYAANDVLYLHKLREELDKLLDREGRKELAYKCFEFLPTRAKLDLLGWNEVDIFSHSTSNK